MTQDEAWIKKYNEVIAFIQINKRNPSKHDDEGMGLTNLVKHQQMQQAAVQAFLMRYYK